MGRRMRIVFAFFACTCFIIQSDRQWNHGIIELVHLPTCLSTYLPACVAYTVTTLSMCARRKDARESTILSHPCSCRVRVVSCIRGVEWICRSAPPASLLLSLHHHVTQTDRLCYLCMCLSLTHPSILAYMSIHVYTRSNVCMHV